MILNITGNYQVVEFKKLINIQKKKKIEFNKKLMRMW